MSVDGIDPDDLAVCLRVLETLDELPLEHPDAVAVRHATAGLFKTVKLRRRSERRVATLAADAAATAATATGASGRIDDETAGLPLRSSAGGPTAGTLVRARACYVCKQRFVELDAFYHQLCPSCAARNHARRDARIDLRGRRALLTGGRAKIGMYIALRLLRDGADTTITTRFPRDAARRFASMADSDDWLHRLRIVGIDLRDPAQVVALADDVAAGGPLDILVNNAAQTVRRSAADYSLLARAEVAPLPAGPLPPIRTFAPVAVAAVPSGTRRRRTGEAALDADARRAQRARAQRRVGLAAADRERASDRRRRARAGPRLRQQLEPARPGRRPRGAAGGPALQPDRAVHPRRQAARRARRVERAAYLHRQRVGDRGSVSPRLQGPGHPHTNMAKAALNMLTRTSAHEMLRDGILMTSVDTGWITDERPHPTKMRLAEDGFHAPLDLVDGAARVYDPIVRGEAGEDLHGCFLKDYDPAPW